jgi:ATP-dependent helicase/nuclease subunit A
VIRLLLSGVPPAKILCLTFTKAAAAQMATRVFATLSDWTRLNDVDLTAAILSSGAPTPTGSDLLMARRLFTRAVETPGGLKIQTIHAFCERLLHLFPFEANVPARFEVADERRTEEMLSRAKQEAFGRAKGGAALALVADIAGGAGIHALIAQSLNQRAAARRAAYDEQAKLSERLGAGPFASAEAVRQAMLRSGLTHARKLAIAEGLDTGLATDQKYAAWLRTTAGLIGPDNDIDIVAALKVYVPIFFDSKGEPRSRLVTNKLGAARPDIRADLESERDRLEALRTHLRSAETIERTQALIDLVDIIVERYDHAKAVQGVLDFDDLIDRTLTLLDRSDSGWVLHKLDAGIDHILVDEAQDTSAAQWKILERLTGDFASGATAGSADRSFFVVGDEKQSIFSFQGAAPLMFDRMRSDFERRFKSGGKPFERVSLKTSFRSVPGILAAVDTVFTTEFHQDGLMQAGDVWPAHDSLKAALPGLVEIWPRVGAMAAPDPEDWSIPLDTPPENDPVNIVADRVARKIKALIAPDSTDRVHHGRSDATRRIRPGDILILVRTRGAFFEAVIRALKRHYVPVAGADRLDVANHIAVMDLVAAGRTALLQDDDLSLACLLKSPLFGLTDEDLIALAPARPGSLFEALGASSVDAHRVAHATIERWSARAVATTPFAFYVELLGLEGGRRLMEARLGPEAHDAIDEFLRLALAHEQHGPPTLGAFLADIEDLESSIKRDMEGPGDAVRVMTVHAAKGLESKIVFLPDTCAVPASQLDPNVFDLNVNNERPPLLVWSPRKTEDPKVVEAARIEARTETLREYRRLLYVAMTRAEERLYIAGFHNTREPPQDSWSAMIERAFPEADEIAAPWGGGDLVLRITSPGAAKGLPAPGDPGPEQADLGLPPDWLWRKVPAPAYLSPLRPSRPPGAIATLETQEGLIYGSALHLLVQYLPGLEPQRRALAARAFLDARSATIPAAMRDPLVAEALSVMSLPELAEVFGPGSRAEVAIMGVLARGDGTSRMVRGTVDRLVATPSRIIAVDFKTGAPEYPPPRGYLEQMALYREVLATLWPDRPIAMCLVWTRLPLVVDLANADLAAIASTLLRS